MPRECVTIHVGQAGVQMGASIWELFCLEYGITAYGTMPVCPATTDTTIMQTLFNDHEYGTFVPRALFVDMEPNVIDEIRIGHYRDLFHPDSYIAGKEDAGSLFAKGYYSIGREYNSITMERIRHMVESCDGLQGFNVFRSIGGGTGSGFGSFLFSKLSTYFEKKSMISYDIIPSPKEGQSDVVEPYNAVLSNHACDGHCHVSFIFDNESLGGICKNRLRNRNPNFYNYNQVLAQVVSGMTAALRFEGATLADFQTNLVPLPRIRYPLVSYAPFVPYDTCLFENFPVGYLVNDVFDLQNHMVRCNPRLGKYMAMVMNFRGNFNQNHINNVKHILRGSPGLPGKIRFIDWTPPGFKVNVSERLPYGVPGTDFGQAPSAVIALMNTTAIAQPFAVLQRKFDLLWNKRAFVHWYTAEGMEEAEFQDARANMDALREDYLDLEMDGGCQIPGIDMTITGKRIISPPQPQNFVISCKSGAEVTKDKPPTHTPSLEELIKQINIII